MERKVEVSSSHKCSEGSEGEQQARTLSEADAARLPGHPEMTLFHFIFSTRAHLAADAQLHKMADWKQESSRCPKDSSHPSLISFGWRFALKLELVTSRALYLDR